MPYQILNRYLVEFDSNRCLVYINSSFFGFNYQGNFLLQLYDLPQQDQNLF
jgi:hypothetical protein